MKLKNSLIGAGLTFSPRFTVKLTDDVLTLKLGDQNHEWTLLNIARIDLTPGIVWSEARITALDGQTLKLDGIDKEEGIRWHCAFEKELHSKLAAAGKEASQAISTWASRLTQHLPSDCWHPSWLGKHLAETKSPAKLTCGLSCDAIASHPSITAASESHPKILKNPPLRLAEELNAKLGVLNEALFERHKTMTLFDTLESTPLTIEQRRAVICFDSKVLLVAAAGSGKTATMVAKAAYALATGITKPHEVLMLAFNADAAEELQQRLDKRLINVPDKNQIACRTFHSFGLSVIGDATGAKPRPAAWLEGGQDVAKVVSIMQQLSESDLAFRTNLMLVRTVFAEPIGKLSDMESEPDDKKGLITSRGETVKSREEQLIADWLFFHGVDYKYESPYPIKTADAQYSQYHPDFYYPAADLFHEHFALNALGEAPEEFKDYTKGVIWKRDLHKMNETALVETTSYTLRSGEGLPALKEALESRGLKLKPDPNRIPPGRPPMENEALARILRNLIQHAKGNRLSPKDLSDRASELDPIRGQLIISLYEKVLARWQAELKTTGTVDFDDMINLATEHAESGRYRSKFKLVIADEYQDASAARARLLKAITSAPDTFLTAVGDDAQSINRFAGADISVMRNFQAFYGSGTVLQLTRTFRCPREICEVSNQFVQQNPIQLKKEVHTTSIVTGKAIQCFAANKESELSSLVEDWLTKIVAKLRSVWDQPHKPTIMLLGRYRSDRPHNMAVLKGICGTGVDINFTTVHSSKGTEADYVLMLNVTGGRKGFPSKIEDDPILQAAMPQPEDFPFAEERRLFYVAITRARRGVFIFTVAGNRSEFLIELANKKQITIIGQDGQEVSSIPCPACGKGSRTRRTSKYGDFYSCSEFPRCRWKSNIRLQ